MNKAQELHDLGQSLWLDNITREILDNGTLRRYINEFSITGLTSNPTIFDEAIGNTAAYDEGIRAKAKVGKSGEALFMELALEDLRRAADLFRPVFDATDGVDGWVSMEVSPLLANDTAGSVAAAEAYLRGIERRIAARRDPRVASVASLFVSRWDKAVGDKVPPELRNRLGIAIGGRTYRAYRELLASPRWKKLAAAGARPQRLLWASTGTKDPKASDTLYVEALAAPDTIDTMPEKTLRAFAEHGQIKGVMAEDGGDAEAILAKFVKAGIDTDALGLQLQRDGAQAFTKSWQELMTRIADKSDALAHAG